QGADALDAVQWDAGKQGLDVGERIDRYADPANLAGRYDMVGVVAALGGQIEGDENLLHSQFDQPFETPVAGLRLAEAGIGRNDERLLPVHRRAVAAGEGKLSRQAQVAQIVE